LLNFILLDCNLAVKHQFGKNIAQFEKAHECKQHDHLICMETGKVIEFCDPRIHEIIQTACQTANFQPSHHSLYIYGLSAEGNEIRKKEKALKDSIQK